MTRNELAHKAYEIFKRDHKAYGDDDVEVWKAIAETDDDSLEEWVYEHERLSNSLFRVASGNNLQQTDL